MELFRWNAWNSEHATKHGIAPAESEAVVSDAAEPFPWRLDDARFLVWGTIGGRWIQVVFLADETTGEIYIIHARPLSRRELAQFKEKT